MDRLWWQKQGLLEARRVSSGQVVYGFGNMEHAVKSAILVTGGAGYIGSHTVQQLRERGEKVVVLDNLSTGFRQAVEGTLIEGDVGDAKLVSHVLREHQVQTVIHFAAHTIVPESVSDPLKYYGNNTCQTRSLLAKEFRVFFHRRGLRHSGHRFGRRGHDAGTD
jgi:dTDP-D-glucose 4,6-dehydratase